MQGDATQSFDFMPHGHCFFWQTDLLFLHVISDLLIAAAYFSIPFALLYLAKKRPDIKLKSIFLLFAAFIMACGITHILNSWNFWYADYWISGFAKAITALISVTTAIMLWKWMPHALQWPSPYLLNQKNIELTKEITKRREQEILLQEAFENAPIGKALVGLDGTWIKVNHALCNILGYSSDELMKMTFQDITYEEDLDQDMQHVADLIEGRANSYQMEKRYKHKSGHLVWALLSVTIVRDDNQSPRYFISQIMDITYRKLTETELKHNRAELEARVEERTRELKELNQELSEKNELLDRLSTTDPLTQLQNRRNFDKKINEIIYESQRYGYEFCIMLIDIDEFKKINDTYGHIQGDKVICKISQILKTNLRQSDIAMRFGGDEFCILLTHTSLRRAPQIAENIRELICKEEFKSDQGESFKMSCSFGIAEFTTAISDSRSILAKADKALYMAKEQGRNQVAVIE